MIDSHPEPIFPAVWDNTIRSTFATCPRLGFYAHILNLRKHTGKSVHLHFGGCLAKGLEVARKAYWKHGKSELDAIAEGVQALIREWGEYEIPPEIENSRSGVKTLDACIDALVSYFEHHQLGNDIIRPYFINGEPAVEMTFAVPVPGVQHPDTKAPLIYAGRFDMLAVYQDAVFVADEKSTLALGSAWRSNWTMRGQFSGYAWGAQSLLPPDVGVAGCFIRGIGIMKQSITFETAILSRPQWQIDQWLRQLRLDIERAATSYIIMRQMFEDQPHLAWDQNLDSACSQYSGCGFINLCDSPDPRRWYDEYITQPWNPLQRQGDEVA